MLLFSRFRNAAAKAGSLLLRFLDTLPPLVPRPLPPPPHGWPDLPEWVKAASADRQKTLEAIFLSRPQGSTSGQSPAESPRSTDPQSSELDNREVTNHYARRDAAERTLTRIGYRWHGGEEWKPPLGKPPTFLTASDRPANPTVLQNVVAHLQERENKRDAAETLLVKIGYWWNLNKWEPNPCTTKGDELRRVLATLEDKRDKIWAEASARRYLLGLGYKWVKAGDYGHWSEPSNQLQERIRLAKLENAETVLVGLGWRWFGTAWIAPPPVGLEPGTAENLRDAIAYALDDHNPDGLEWLRSWNEGDPSAQAELEEWRERERKAAAQRRPR
jgi:hypothetical protein